MSFNYSKLRGRIREKCGTQDAFAKLLGIGNVSLSARLNNKIDFDSREISDACEILSIPRDEIPQYFFCEESSETRTA